MALQIKYKKCTEQGVTTPCETSGAGAGKINTALLEGELVYLDAAHTKIGIRFKPKTGNVIAEYNCASLTLHVEERGEVIDEQLGDIGFATKLFKGVLEEGPLHAQQWPYAGQLGTEENELEYAEWEVPISELGKASSPPFGWTGSSYVPAYANAVLTGAKNFEGPSTWNADSEYKGADIMVEA